MPRRPGKPPTALATFLQPLLRPHERLVYDLVHVEILVGAATPDEGQVRGLGGKRGIAIVDRLVPSVARAHRIVPFHAVLGVVTGRLTRMSARSPAVAMVRQHVPGGLAGPLAVVGVVRDGPGHVGDVVVRGVLELY